MKISLKWLSDYIELDDLSADEIAEIITKAGLEVDEIIDNRKVYDNFVVGFVKETKKHPNADKLTLCVVTDGKEDFNVVCGAPNVKTGQKIAFAKVGAKIPNGEFEIKKAKIRGEVSTGMICSESELGISDNHDGIMVLDSSLKEGTELSKALGLDDVTFEIDLTPNRADALSHIGIARDLSASLNRPFKLPDINLNEIDEESSKFARVSIEDFDGCPRYIGKVVKDVTVKESPDWLKKKLTSIGLRPINNIVDATNYVLHEIGQPLHAFDLDLLEGNEIVVRQAGNKKKFVTLDSKERELVSTDLMICDGKKPVAFAGIMGGENSEVTEKTKNILIESAYFNSSRIRKTAKRIGLSTDASYRFERGTDIEITLWAARRAAQLIGELADGKVCKGELDVYPNKFQPKVVDLRFDRLNKIMGFLIDMNKVTDIIKNLGIKVTSVTEEKLTADIPAFRPDIEREIDLIEEVARINGYDNVPVINNINVVLEKNVDQSKYVDELREKLAGLGFNEIITNSLLNNERNVPFGNPISLRNPQSKEMSHLRTSLLPGALQTISNNLKVREHNLSLFEIGHTFENIGKGEIKSFEDISEKEMLLMIMTGKINEDEWYSKSIDVSVFNLKGTVEELLHKLGILLFTNTEFRKEDIGLKDILAYTYKNITICKIGQVEENLLKEYDIEQEVFAAEVNIDELKKIEIKEKSFTPLLKYPKVIRDCAFVLDQNIMNSDVEKTIKDGSSNLLKNIKLFDIFESDSLGEGKKSLAFQLEYFDSTRTLTEEEVDKEFWKAIETVKRKLNAQLRGR